MLWFSFIAPSSHSILYFLKPVVALSPDPYRYLKGFAWYRAWVVKCHPNDTFDVRFTRPPSLPSDTYRRREAAAAREQRPEVDTSSPVSGSEEAWNSDKEVSWKVVSKDRISYGDDTAHTLRCSIQLLSKDPLFWCQWSDERSLYSRENVSAHGTKTTGNKRPAPTSGFVYFSRRTLPCRRKKSGKRPAITLPGLQVRTSPGLPSNFAKTTLLSSPWQSSTKF